MFNGIEIVTCANCMYAVEKHYEEEGEEPYVKKVCGNKYGLQNGYTIYNSDFCSRGKRREDGVQG